jgi:hypothetical protein
MTECLCSHVIYDLSCFISQMIGSQFFHCSAVDLGVHIWYANVLGDIEAVDAELLSSQLIFIPITVHGSDYWVTVAHNHVCAIQIVLLPLFIVH